MESPAFSILKNPMTNDYEKIKQFIFSEQMSWMYADKVISDEECIERFSKKFPNEKFGNIPLFSHIVLSRPVDPYYTSVIMTTQEFFIGVNNIITQILNYNEILVNNFYRININMTMYSDSEFFTPPHVDHDFPHKNFILYLTQPSSGGNLKIYKNKKWNTYQVKEDEAIIFEGMHCHSPVTTPGERRVAIVATFI